MSDSSNSNTNNTLQIPTTAKSNNTSLPAPPVIEVPKLELDTSRKDKPMGEFLAMMDNYAPIVSDTTRPFFTSIVKTTCRYPMPLLITI